MTTISTTSLNNLPGLVDSNIFIYAHDADSPFFKRANKFLKEIVLSKNCYLAEQIFLESYRILTQKIEKPISEKSAWKIIDYYLTLNIVKILRPSEKTLRITRRLSIRYQIKGVRIFDAYLVALMLENRLSYIYTRNTSDFQVFSEIKVINPLA